MYQNLIIIALLIVYILKLVYKFNNFRYNCDNAN
jgi:hypothetical protein